MQPAHLRPVPSRPAGLVEQTAAASHVAARLPGLSEGQARALSLIVLAGRPRAATAAETSASPEELAASLAAARKALRRTLGPLSGSGWCERAERLISDRLDGELGERDVARLDAHLRNCPRCVEHERKLVQATDALVASFAGAAAEPAPAAVLSIVEPPQAAAEEAPPERPVSAPESAEARDPRGIASAGAWRALLVVAIILALVSIGLSVAAILGAQI
jgi:Putative zinc-finger